MADSRCSANVNFLFETYILGQGERKDHKGRIERRTKEEEVSVSRSKRKNVSKSFLSWRKSGLHAQLVPIPKLPFSLLWFNLWPFPSSLAPSLEKRREKLKLKSVNFAVSNCCPDLVGRREDAVTKKVGNGVNISAVFLSPLFSFLQHLCREIWVPRLPHLSFIVWPLSIVLHPPTANPVLALSKVTSWRPNHVAFS